MRIENWKMVLGPSFRYILPPTSYILFLRSHPNQFIELNRVNWGPLCIFLSQNNRRLNWCDKPRNSGPSTMNSELLKSTSSCARSPAGRSDVNNHFGQPTLPDRLDLELVIRDHLVCPTRPVAGNRQRVTGGSKGIIMMACLTP